MSYTKHPVVLRHGTGIAVADGHLHINTGGDIQEFIIEPGSMVYLGLALIEAGYAKIIEQAKHNEYLLDGLRECIDVLEGDE